MPIRAVVEVPFPPRLRLSRIPTPIEMLQWLPHGVAESGVEIFVKRDDLTGCDLTGNKVRKLDFLLADALAQDCDTVVTCGAVNSNHCRATVLSAARLGMRSSILLRGPAPQSPDGNLFLCLLAGAEVEHVTPEQYAERDSYLAEMADRLLARGRKPYIIPEGGSNPLGCFGYINCVREIAYQSERLEYEFTHIVCATGSGGTQSGLILGTRAYLPDVQVVGFNVSQTAEAFTERISHVVDLWLREFSSDLVVSREDIVVVDGYTGPGYGLNVPEDLAIIRQMARSQGLLLDPVYTAKAFRGLCEEARRGRFLPGSKVLFLHTGGMMELFTHRAELLVEPAPQEAR